MRGCLVMNPIGFNSHSTRLRLLGLVFAGACACIFAGCGGATAPTPEGQCNPGGQQVLILPVPGSTVPTAAPFTVYIASSAALEAAGGYYVTLINVTTGKPLPAAGPLVGPVPSPDANINPLPFAMGAAIDYMESGYQVQGGQTYMAAIDGSACTAFPITGAVFSTQATPSPTPSP
jgi:hypothetical protein